MSVRFFSSDYGLARTRFRTAAERAGFELAAYPIDAKGPDGSALTIDVARKGKVNARRSLVVSSGTHGVEGFFGSAVQLALLERRLSGHVIDSERSIVLVHAINPYGFAWRRRVNEDNIDLNRNFLLPGQPFSGAPPAYGELDALLNPSRPPSALEPFLLVAGLKILRHGFAALKSAVAQGQYDFPQGVFFGGHGPSQSQRIFTQHAPAWLGTPERVLHLDFHTGLGAWASYALCVDLPVEHPRVAQLKSEFGADNVQSYDPKGVMYEIRGALGSFLASRFPNTQYDCLLAEFGTYSPLRVLQAMRRENCVHLHARTNAALDARAKQELVEVFCPKADAWRETVVERALSVCDRALQLCG